MIRITIELLPYGNEKDKEVISTMDIINDGTGNVEIGNYIYEIKEGKQLLNGNIKNHLRSSGIWILLKSIFKKISKSDLKELQDKVDRDDIYKDFLGYLTKDLNVNSYIKKQ